LRGLDGPTPPRACGGAEPHLAHQSIHSRDGEVHKDGGTRCPDVRSSVAFVRLGCKQELVDYSSRICLLAQAGGSLLQSLGALRFVACGDLQGIGAL